MRHFRFQVLVILIVLNSAYVKGQQEKSALTMEASFNKKRTPVSSLKITCLSTLVSNGGIGEWGYSALVEVDGKKILFDTGNRPETVYENAKFLDIDLSDVEDVFLSHNHGDHTGGLLSLRKELKKSNPDALTRVHIAKGLLGRLKEENKFPALSVGDIEELKANGIQFIEHENQHELFPGVWITGPIERIHNEQNWDGKNKKESANGSTKVRIPEDQSLVIDTEDGFVLISGCGHAGIINIMEHIRANIHKEKVHAAIGGFHLVNATDEQLKWTADKLQDFGVSKIIGAHCTGINALYTLKDLLNLSRSDAVVGSVGDFYELETGINAGYIAR